MVSYVVKDNQIEHNQFTMEVNCIVTTFFELKNNHKKQMTYKRVLAITETNTHTHIFGDQLPRDRNLC